LKWEKPDEEKLVEFMCTKNGFRWVLPSGQNRRKSSL